MSVSPSVEGKAVSRLLEHCVRLDWRAEAKAPPRDRLEAALGDELSRRLLGALAGDHRLPPRGLSD